MSAVNQEHKPLPNLQEGWCQSRANVNWTAADAQRIKRHLTDRRDSDGQMFCVKPSFALSLRIQATCHNFFSLPRGEKSDSNNFRKSQFRI